MDESTKRRLALTALGAVGSALSAYLLRDRSFSERFAVGSLIFAVPHIIDALTRTTEDVLLFVSDTHGAASTNEKAADVLTAQDASLLVHGGDVADSAELFEPWWDRPFYDVTQKFRVIAAEGNHDTVGSDEFRSRFGRLPAKIALRNTDLFVLPWNAERHADWLLDQAANSAAKWKVLAVHQPLWTVRGDDPPASRLRNALSKSLPFIHLILSGHEHVRGLRKEKLANGHEVIQVVELTGPKFYSCTTACHASCRERERGFTKVLLGNRLRVSRSSL